MRDDRDAAIVTLLFLAFTCVTMLFLKLAEPTGGLAAMLFPRVDAEYGLSGKISEERSSHLPPGGTWIGSSDAR